ncbi:uncharacterized protein LOC141664082 isoform X1 [Apium graveolens]|uniref:uncharacterized protein LOC141664082 isoform X1 n=1 Tax=Apium graveolens TaxID=4045 RepID=UPI003D7B4A08
MACPHVSGAAAYVKSLHPKWSASAIQSSLMTTDHFPIMTHFPVITDTVLYNLRAYKLYVREGGLMNNRKEFLWHHSEVQCPQQERGTACDFFVMRYIHDIIMLSQKNSTIIGKWVLVQGTIPKRKLKRYESFGDSFYFRMFLTREK